MHCSVKIIRQPLLLFDEILRKGFDGHNFIVGLSEHFRNLLVSQDARTTNLMEVPESVKKKYAVQAQSASPSLLLTWLNIANQCDINYKNCKNQRLSVELSLMKMANVAAVVRLDELELPDGGIKKKSSLKSVEEEMSPLTSSSTPSKKENGHSVLAEPVTIQVETESPVKNERPVFKSSSKTTIKLTDLLKGKSPDQTVETVEEGEANEPFTSEQLHLVWRDFAEQRKKFQAEYQLLTQPVEIRGSQIIVQLLSSVQETMLSNFKNDLISYLRTHLKNNSILVIGELRETEERQMLYTARDKFEYLIEKNPMLKILRDRLGLDPDF